MSSDLWIFQRLTDEQDTADLISGSFGIQVWTVSVILPTKHHKQHPSVMMITYMHYEKDNQKVPDKFHSTITIILY